MSTKPRTRSGWTSTYQRCGPRGRAPPGDRLGLLEQGHDVLVQRVGPFGREGAFQADDAVAVEAAHDRRGVIILTAPDAPSEIRRRNYHLWLALRARIRLGASLQCAFSPTMRRPRTRRCSRRSPPSNRLDTAYDGDAWSQKLDGAFSDLFETRGARAVGDDRHRRQLPRARRSVPAATAASSATATRISRVDEAGAPGFFTARRQADAGRRPGRQGRARRGGRSDRPHPQGRPPGPAARRCRSPTRPNMAWPTRAAEVAALGRARASATGLRFHMDGARFANAIVSTGESPADITWRAGVEALSFGFVKNGGLNAEALILFKTELADEVAGSPQARRAFAVQGPHARRANSRDARERSVARQRPRRQCRRADARRGRGATGSSIRSRPMRFSSRVSADEAASLRAQGFDFYDWGAGRNPAGHQLGPAGRAVEQARRGDRRPMSAASAGRFTSVILPFIIFTAHLGLDLDRHPRPARHRAAAMVGRLPLRHRRRGDGALARWKGESLRLGRGRHGGRRFLGFAAVRDQFQRRLSRRAAHHLGPGGDRVRAAADPQQPARPGPSSASGRAPLRRGARWSRSPASPCCSRTSSASIRRERTRSCSASG